MLGWKKHKLESRLPGEISIISDMQKDFPGGSDSKASCLQCGRPGSIPGSGRSSGEGNGNPLQYFCLENPMDRGAWWAKDHEVTKSQTRLSDFTFTFRYADDTTLTAESKEELRRFLMKVKEEREKVGLKLNIQKTKIMASGPITSWQLDGETVTDFIFLSSTITADGDCSHEIKRRLLFGRQVMTNLDSILKIVK